MRAVKADLATPLREGVERVAEEEGPRWAKRRVLARRGREGEKGRAVSPTQPTLWGAKVGRGTRGKPEESAASPPFFARGAPTLKQWSHGSRARLGAPRVGG